MGHAMHFLQRLERLSTSQLDYALELYRSSELVRYILEQSRLPDGADRVALALEDREGGPHILVARNGGFVTCLGEGMSVGGLPVITRGQIDRLGSQYEGLREAQERSRDRRETRRLFKNLADSGRALSREDFSALVAMMPIMEGVCVAGALEFGTYVLDFQRRYTRSRYRRLTAKVNGELRQYWASSWAVGHLVALCGTRGRELGDNLPEELHKGRLSLELSRMATHSMNPPVVLRGGWAAARMGRQVVAEAKQTLGAKTFLDVMVTTLPLVMTGLRHRRARAEVHKLLSREARAVEDIPDDVDRSMSRLTLKVWLSLFDHDGDKVMRALHRSAGERLALERGASLPEGHPLRYERAEDVPEDLALALPMNVETDMYREPGAMLLLGMVLPWMATADAAAFYLPADLVDVYAAPWSPRDVRDQLEAQHEYFYRDQPIRAVPRPGRNDPCSCGSGVKYKRCCGA